MRNLLVWKKLAVPSMLGNIAEPLITLVAFGYGVGSLIGQVDGLPYIEYLASGSVAVSAALAATFEALYSAYSRMAVQKTWDSILNAPVALDDIVFAEMLWAAIKALFSCAAILVVIFVLGISRAPSDAAGAAGARPGRDHVRVAGAGLQRARQGLRLFHLLLHARHHADDLPLGRVFPDRPDAAVAAGRGRRCCR